MKKLFFFVIIVFAFQSLNAQTTVYKEKGLLPQAAVTLITDIKIYYPQMEFDVSDTASKYYTLVNGTKIYSELEIYHGANGLYKGLYVSYNYFIYPDDNVITYDYSVGQMYSASGEISIVGGKFIKTQYGHGTGAGAVEIWVDGISIYKSNK
jgi:hypothetical protein